jgi:hypothetical protein
MEIYKGLNYLHLLVIEFEEQLDQCSYAPQCENVTIVTVAIFILYNHDRAREITGGEQKAKACCFQGTFSP